ncbi:MAG TPA: hypothetical protein V6D02_12300 [Candidatus Obscuribacterales bacterium]
MHQFSLSMVIKAIWQRLKLRDRADEGALRLVLLTLSRPGRGSALAVRRRRWGV